MVPFLTIAFGSGCFALSDASGFGKIGLFDDEKLMADAALWPPCVFTSVILPVPFGLVTMMSGC